MSKLRTAVIGVGHLGRHHARILSQIPGVELAFVVDSDMSRAKSIAETCGAKPAEDYRKIAGEIDAVTIASPTLFHYEIAKFFINSRIPVLIEKPITPDLEQAQELVGLAAQKNVPIQAGHVERFNPAVIAAGRYIHSPKFIECHRLSHFTFRSTDISAIHDMMIHDIDLVMHFTGAEPLSVDASGACVLTDKVDIANARLKFPGSCVANLTASRISDKTVRKIRVFSPESYVIIDTQKKSCTVYSKTEKLKALLKGKSVPDVDLRNVTDLKEFVFKEFIKIEKLKVPDEEPLKNELESFVHSVISGVKPVVSGEQALMAMRTADRILKSIDDSCK